MYVKVSVAGGRWWSKLLVRSSGMLTKRPFAGAAPSGGRGEGEESAVRRCGHVGRRRSHRIHRQVVVVEVGRPLDGGAVGAHRVAGGAGIYARDVEEDDRGQDAEDGDDDQQLDNGNPPWGWWQGFGRRWGRWGKLRW